MKFKNILLPVFLALALTGCGYAENNTEEHGQRMDCPFFEEEITMYPGEVVSGWMSIQGGDTAYDEVVFYTDDPSVAKINLTDTRADMFLYYEIYAAGEGDTYVCAKTEDGETLSPKQHVTVSKNETETETETEYYVTAGRIDETAPETKRETETERETEPETDPPAVFYIPESETESEELVSLVLNTPIRTKYETNYDTSVSYDISDEDYNLYNEIMDYLYAYPDESEDVLFEELSGIYDKSASELRQFVIDNMQKAIDRKMGKGSAKAKITTEDVIAYAKEVIQATVKNDTYFSDSADAWEISATGLRCLIKTSFGITPSSYTEEAIVKIEFSDDYKTFELFQLKYNGRNINLN